MNKIIEKNSMCNERGSACICVLQQTNVTKGPKIFCYNPVQRRFAQGAQSVTQLSSRSITNTASIYKSPSHSVHF